MGKLKIDESNFQAYRDNCVKLLFRSKIPRTSSALLKLFEHYSGLEDFLEPHAVPEVELFEILKYQPDLSYFKLTSILKELYVSRVRVASNEFHAFWDPYNSTFKDFLNEHHYVRVWEEPNPLHLPDTLLVKYGDF